jgi:RHS repeat-associated protein
VADSATIYDNRFLFTGREYAATYRSTYTNTAFNFYEYRARAYNPKLGRFMSEDPKLFDAGDYNLFRYCHNDPIDFTDPMGTVEREPWFTHHQQAIEMDAGNAQWAMAKWADSSNNFQGTFAQFTAGQGLTMGQTTQKAGQGVTLRPRYRQMNEEKLASLDPRFAPMARRFVDAANSQVNPEGVEVRISHGTRSLAEQADLYQKLRGKGVAPPRRAPTTTEWR